MYKMELILFKGSETHQFTGGANLISAVLVLALMILPTVINISESALRSVPAHLKSASLALGATKIQTIFQVIVPAAKSGIITAVVLGTGRAIGEAMAISLVSGSSVNLLLPFHTLFVSSQQPLYRRWGMPRVFTDRCFSPLVWYCLHSL